MCGRYTVGTSGDIVAEVFGLSTEAAASIAPRYNLAPSQLAPVVRRAGDAARELVELEWGFLPFWARSHKWGSRPINARVETVATHGMFRSNFSRRRALVLADGFYEWDASSQPKQPWFFYLEDRRTFAMAGLWEGWSGEGERVESFTIVTTPANALLEPIHHRMPAILREDAFDAWLHPESSPDKLLELLQPLPAVEMASHAVSRFVNSSRNESRDCILDAADVSPENDASLF